MIGRSERAVDGGGPTSDVFPARSVLQHVAAEVGPGLAVDVAPRLLFVCKRDRHVPSKVGLEHSVCHTPSDIGPPAL